MGCGQSQFSLIYPKKFRRKDRDSRDVNEDETDEENEDDNKAATVTGRLVSNRSMPNLLAAVEEERCFTIEPETSTLSNSALVYREMSASQIDFFRMLDEKIESGPDYDETNEKERLREFARTRQLLLEWERAKQRRLPRSLSGSAAHPAVQTASFYQQQQAQQQLSRKQRFAMPHLNGDVNKQYQYPVYNTSTFRLQQQQQLSQQYTAVAGLSTLSASPSSSSSSQQDQQKYTLSNSVVMYDQTRGQYYTELA